MTKNFQSLYLYFLLIISPITICYQTNLIINIEPAMSQVPTSSEDFKEIERMNNQALVLQEEGKYKEAETLFLKAIEKFKISPKKNFKNMTILLSNLGSLYAVQKDYTKLESTLLEIFDIYIKIK